MLKTSFKITITQMSVAISNYIKPGLQLYIHMKQKIYLLMLKLFIKYVKINCVFYLLN